MDHFLSVENERQRTKMPKLYLLLQIGYLIYNFCSENSSINPMKTVTCERCNTHTLYHSVRIIIPKIINNMK